MEFIPRAKSHLSSQETDEEMEEDEDNQSASNRRNGGRRGRGKKGRWLDCTPIEDRISFCKVLDVFRLFYWSFEHYYVGF